MVKKVMTYVVVVLIFLTTFSCSTRQYGVGALKIKKNGPELSGLIRFHTRVYGYNPTSPKDLMKLIEKDTSELDSQRYYSNIYTYIKDNGTNLIFENGFDSKFGDSTIAIYYKHRRHSNLLIKTTAVDQCSGQNMYETIFFDKHGVYFFSDSLNKVLRDKLSIVCGVNAGFLRKDSSERYVWTLFDYTLGGNLVDMCSKRVVNYSNSPYSANLHDLLNEFAITNNLSRIRVPTYTD